MTDHAEQNFWEGLKYFRLGTIFFFIMLKNLFSEFHGFVLLLQHTKGYIRDIANIQCHSFSLNVF